MSTDCNFSLIVRLFVGLKFGKPALKGVDFRAVFADGIANFIDGVAGRDGGDDGFVGQLRRFHRPLFCFFLQKPALTGLQADHNMFGAYFFRGGCHA